VAAQRDSRLDLVANLTRAAGGPVWAGCRLTICTPAVILGPAGWPRSARYPRDRRSRAPLAIRHHGDGPADSAKARTSATAPAARPSDSTALAAIHPQPCQPGPAPLHARGDDSGDTGRRSGTPTGSPADGPWPTASEQCPTQARGESIEVGGQRRSGDQRHGDGSSDNTALTAIQPQAGTTTRWR
jgi:hypothetical protein